MKTSAKVQVFLIFLSLLVSASVNGQDKAKTSKKLKETVLQDPSKFGMEALPQDPPKFEKERTVLSQIAIFNPFDKPINIVITYEDGIENGTFEFKPKAEEWLGRNVKCFYTINSDQLSCTGVLEKSKSYTICVLANKFCICDK